MVAIHHTFVTLSLAVSALAAAGPAHEKRLFGLNFGSPSPTTTTSTTSSSSSSSTSSTSSTSLKAATTSSSVKVTTTSSAPLATGTNTPPGNTRIYWDLNAIAVGGDKLGTYTLNSYVPQACETLCAANAACSFYNIYQAQSLAFLFFAPSTYCALYDNQHSAADAWDFGTTSLQSYSNSNGYVMYADNSAQVTVPVGTAAAPTGTPSSSIAATTSTAKSTSAAAVTTTSSSTSSTTKSSTSSSSTVASTTSLLAAVAAPINAAVSSSSVLAVVPTMATSSKSVALAVPTTSLALPTTSLALPTTSLALPTTSLALPTTSLALPTTSALLSKSLTVPSTTLAVAVTSVLPTTSISLPTSKLPATAVVPSASISLSASAACALPTWAYSGWCSTLPSMVPQMLANAASPGSLHSGFIIPLYIYPSWWTTPGAWDWVYTAAANSPSVQFTVIINPASGPGTGVLPNTDYQHELSKLGAISNVAVLGYVDTAYGSRDASLVANDISTYAGWASASSQLALDGIFFDNQAAGANYLSTYDSYASQVRKNPGFSGGIVGFAPGQICNPGYVDIADFVVIFEQASSVVQSDLFGWYASFLGGLSTSQLTKIVWMLSGADQTTDVAVTNIQAAMNPKYMYLTDNTGSWGAQFQSAPSASFLNKALAMIAQPLSLLSTVVAN